MTIAFDLDDTLFPEVDFVKSAFRALSRQYDRQVIAGLVDNCSSLHDAFDEAARILSIPVEQIIDFYRNHLPDDLKLEPSIELKLHSFLKRGFTLALLTDGRSVTQRNKIRSLGLDRFFLPEMIFISEEKGVDKSSPQSFLQIEKASCNPPYFYIGDNPSKDFFQPRRLGWTTVMITDKGQNIHSQNLKELPDDFHPDAVIDSIEELF